MGGHVLFLIPFIAIIEIFLIIKIGGAIGFLPTVSIVLCTGITGVWLLRQQGFQLIIQLNNRLNQGDLPATELLEGVALMIGGVMLVTPGFLTDICGFCLLIPWTRHRLISRISSALEKHIQSGGNVTYYQSRGGFYHQTGYHQNHQAGNHQNHQTGFRQQDEWKKHPGQKGSGIGEHHTYEGEFTEIDETEDDHPEKK